MNRFSLPIGTGRAACRFVICCLLMLTALILSGCGGGGGGGDKVATQAPLTTAALANEQVEFNGSELVSDPSTVSALSGGNSAEPR